MQKDPRFRCHVTGVAALLSVFLAGAGELHAAALSLHRVAGGGCGHLKPDRLRGQLRSCRHGGLGGRAETANHEPADGHDKRNLRRIHR
jgi:hypothetical protein